MHASNRSEHASPAAPAPAAAPVSAHAAGLALSARVAASAAAAQKRTASPAVVRSSFSSFSAVASPVPSAIATPLSQLTAWRSNFSPATSGSAMRAAAATLAPPPPPVFAVPHFVAATPSPWRPAAYATPAATPAPRTAVQSFSSPPRAVQPAAATTVFSPFSSTGAPALGLTIESAMHLPLLPAAAAAFSSSGTPRSHGGEGRLVLPNTFVTFELQQQQLGYSAASSSSLHSGSTHLCAQSVCPRWNHSSGVLLIQLLPSTANSASDDALLNALEGSCYILRLWHRPAPARGMPSTVTAASPYARGSQPFTADLISQRDDELLGSATVPLSVLLHSASIASASSSAAPLHQQWYSLNGSHLRSSIQLSIALTGNTHLRALLQRYSAAQHEEQLSLSRPFTPGFSSQRRSSVLDRSAIHSPFSQSLSPVQLQMERRLEELERLVSPPQSHRSHVHSNRHTPVAVSFERAAESVSGSISPSSEDEYASRSPQRTPQRMHGSRSQSRSPGRSAHSSASRCHTPSRLVSPPRTHAVPVDAHTARLYREDPTLQPIVLSDVEVDEDSGSGSEEDTQEQSAPRRILPLQSLVATSVHSDAWQQPNSVSSFDDLHRELAELGQVHSALKIKYLDQPRAPRDQPSSPLSASRAAHAGALPVTSAAAPDLHEHIRALTAALEKAKRMAAGVTPAPSEHKLPADVLELGGDSSRVLSDASSSSTPGESNAAATRAKPLVLQPSPPRGPFNQRPSSSRANSLSGAAAPLPSSASASTSPLPSPGSAGPASAPGSGSGVRPPLVRKASNSTMASRKDIIKAKWGAKSGASEEQGGAQALIASGIDAADTQQAQESAKTVQPQVAATAAPADDGPADSIQLQPFASSSSSHPASASASPPMAAAAHAAPAADLAAPAPWRRVSLAIKTAALKSLQQQQGKRKSVSSDSTVPQGVALMRERREQNRAQWPTLTQLLEASRAQKAASDAVAKASSAASAQKQHPPQSTSAPLLSRGAAAPLPESSASTSVVHSTPSFSSSPPLPSASPEQPLSAHDLERLQVVKVQKFNSWQAQKARTAARDGSAHSVAPLHPGVNVSALAAGSAEASLPLLSPSSMPVVVLGQRSAPSAVRTAKSHARSRSASEEEDDYHAQDSDFGEDDHDLEPAISSPELLPSSQARQGAPTPTSLGMRERQHPNHDSNAAEMLIAGDVAARSRPPSSQRRPSTMRSSDVSQPGPIESEDSSRASSRPASDVDTEELEDAAEEVAGMMSRPRVATTGSFKSSGTGARFLSVPNGASSSTMGVAMAPLTPVTEEERGPSASPQAWRPVNGLVTEAGVAPLASPILSSVALPESPRLPPRASPHATAPAPGKTHMPSRKERLHAGPAAAGSAALSSPAATHESTAPTLLDTTPFAAQHPHVPVTAADSVPSPVTPATKKRLALEAAEEQRRAREAHSAPEVVAAVIDAVIHPPHDHSHHHHHHHPLAPPSPLLCSRTVSPVPPAASTDDLLPDAAEPASPSPATAPITAADLAELQAAVAALESTRKQREAQQAQEWTRQFESKWSERQQKHASKKKRSASNSLKASQVMARSISQPAQLMTLRDPLALVDEFDLLSPSAGGLPQVLSPRSILKLSREADKGGAKGGKAFTDAVEARWHASQHLQQPEGVEEAALDDEDDEVEDDENDEGGSEEDGYLEDAEIDAEFPSQSLTEDMFPPRSSDGAGFDLASQSPTPGSEVNAPLSPASGSSAPSFRSGGGGTGSGGRHGRRKTQDLSAHKLYTIQPSSIASAVDPYAFVQRSSRNTSPEPAVSVSLHTSSFTAGGSIAADATAHGAYHFGSNPAVTHGQTHTDGETGKMGIIAPSHVEPSHESLGHEKTAGDPAVAAVADAEVASHSLNVERHLPEDEGMYIGSRSQPHTPPPPVNTAFSEAHPSKAANQAATTMEADGASETRASESSSAPASSTADAAPLASSPHSNFPLLPASFTQQPPPPPPAESDESDQSRSHTPLGAHVSDMRRVASPPLSFSQLQA